jgi:hypothetical protein
MKKIKLLCLVVPVVAVLFGAFTPTTSRGSDAAVLKAQTLQEDEGDSYCKRPPCLTGSLEDPLR